jgi:hypothetical protein
VFSLFSLRRAHPQVSFALVVPLCALAALVLGTALLFGRCPSLLRLPRLGRRASAGAAPARGKPAPPAPTSPARGSAPPARLAISPTGREMLAARGALLQQTKAKMRELTESRGVFLRSAPAPRARCVCSLLRNASASPPAAPARFPSMHLQHHSPRAQPAED